MPDLLKKMKKSWVRLNQIDIGDIVDKLKNIDVNAAKNLSFSDLWNKANPIAISVVASISFVGVCFYAIIIPKWREMELTRQVLSQYNIESMELPLLIETFEDIQKKQIERQKEFDIVTGFVSEKSVELFTSKFFSETSKLSNVELLGVNPLRTGVPFSCIEPDQDEFIVEETFLPEEPLANDQIDIDPNEPPPFDSNEPPPFDPNEPPPFDLSEPFDPDQSDPSILDSSKNSDPSNNSKALLKSDLSSFFTVNRFQLSLRGNYMNVIDYLRFLNQYKQTLAPICLEVFATPIPPSPADAVGGATNPEPRYVGEVNVKLIVDIPQR